ncbi:glycosyltransferase [Tamlana sp. 2201CG12-4]|uniref:glycosyltransferase n=1 Tax=Tamlana sp. 2201CG12-4 TaxID=3112582 RepID=UPI002DBD76F9|nr:glycosyltransferase [Tamlana sp. 2201CG12-4]MEC3907248.1 glycosyltransferase [Tamlana sp. 2201CG12-4]
MKKVCIVTTSLGKGGAERSSALLSQMLSNICYDVHILMTKNDIDYEFFGTLFNLEKKYGHNLSNLKKIKILKAYFKEHDFDIIIDNRTRPSFLKEYILYNYVFKAKKKISVVRSYYLANYFPNNIWLAKWLYRSKSVLVPVSKEIGKAIYEKYNLSSWVHIYNPISVDTIINKSNEEIKPKTDFILWYGRIEERVKNLTLLLHAYKMSSLSNRRIKLYIIGEGKDVCLLNERINNLKLSSSVSLLPFTKNPFPYVKRARFTVLTSRYEGFPRVLIESLSCGTPVVSVNCKSGPKEIIKHKENGLLVENNNPEALAAAFNAFINDKTLYNYCKENAKKSVNKFSVNHIAEQWKALLK